MDNSSDTVGGRLAELRQGLEIPTQAEMARRVASLVGTGTTSGRVSDWIRGAKDPSPESLAAVSMLHPRPRMCLLWLRKGGEMPRIRVDWADRPKEGESDADYLRRKGGALVRLGKAYVKAATDLQPLDIEVEIPSLSGLVSDDETKHGSDDGTR